MFYGRQPPVAFGMSSKIFHINTFTSRPITFCNIFANILDRKMIIFSAGQVGVVDSKKA